MTPQRQKYRFYHFCLGSVCLDIFVNFFIMYASPLPVQCILIICNFLLWCMICFLTMCFCCCLNGSVVFPLFKQFPETEMIWSQPIVVRECIIKNQNLCFASRALRVDVAKNKFNVNVETTYPIITVFFSLLTYVAV